MKKTWLIVLTALIGLFPSCACIVKLIPGEPDFTPPTFTVLTPVYQGTQPVPYPVSFQVKIEDPSCVYYNPADPTWSISLRTRNSYLNSYSSKIGFLMSQSVSY